MVLLAAAVCTKSGKALVSRQFVEMTKSRIEGLLAAFPKLMTGGRQHTFVETESVRYVYQPLDRLYMVLITTRASNILEDLETLRLFSRVVPEYCRNLEESEIQENAFHLIFAFDEIVALGYRESVNLAQIRTFVEMDSHEEKVYKAVRETQEREARIKMKEKAKELQRKRYEEAKRGGKSTFPGSSGFGSSFNGSSVAFTAPATMTETRAETPVSQDTRSSVSRASVSSLASGNAMKLGSRAKDVDTFVDALKSEGERVGGAKTADGKSKANAEAADNVNAEPIHLTMSEEMNVTCGRDGGLQNMEVQGILKLRISDPDYGFVKIQVENNERRNVQLQTHPNVDRELWRSHGEIGMKVVEKPFPSHTDVGVLKWRWQTSQDDAVPLSVNCWPQEAGGGRCDVNIEYTLEDDSLELEDFQIAIPVGALGAGAAPPVVHACDGEHELQRAKGMLIWRVPLVAASCASGVMEFSARGEPDVFFPVTVSFVSQKSYCNLKVTGVMSTKTGLPEKYSSDMSLKSSVFQVV